MSTIKRCISLLLAALMILGIVPSSAFAISTESHPQENTVLVEKTTHESKLFEPMGATADGLDYVVHSDQVTIYGYRGTATDVVIPSQIEGLPVTSIHSGTFRSCTSLTSIYIPDSVTHIGEFAFYCCYNLTNIYIPDSITEIGEYTFYRCHGLNSITIPDSVTHIGDNAFAFSGNLVSVYIPDSVTHIGDRAFCGCDSLTSVFIPDSVIYIGEAAFSGFSLTGIHVDDDNPSYSSDDQGVLFDKGKTRLIQAPDAIQDFYTIPDSVSDIGIFAFCGTNLTSITIPDSVTYIGYAAFSDCYRLASIRFKGNAPEFDDGGDIFYGVTATASYPARNPTWASYVMQDYGGSITWEPYYLDGEIAASVYDYFDDTMIRISPLELDSLWSLFAPLTGVTLSSWNEEVILTEGEYFIRRADASLENVVLSKDGYRDYILPTEVAKTMREEDGIAYALTAYMQKDTKDGKPYISTVFGRESGGDNTYTDLRVTPLSVKEDSGSDIVVTAVGFGNQDVTYYLAQDFKRKISSSDGVFPNEWLYDIFDDTSTVYAYAVGSDGTQTEPLEIRINREEPFDLAKELLDDSEWSFFGQDCFKIALSDDIPLLGGTELDISAFTFPVGVFVDGDEMKISLGTDLFSSTEDDDGYKWKAFKDLVIKQEEVNTEAIDAFFKDYDKNYGENWKKSKKANKFNVNVLGFVEGKWINGEFVIKEGQINLGGNFKFQYNAQGAVWVVPVYGYVEAGADFNAGGKVNRFLPDRDIPFEFTMLLNVAPKLKGGAGAGIKDAASAGLYAEGKLPLMIAFQEEHVKLDLHGEIGVEGELFLLHGRKVLLEGDTNLIDWYYGSSDSPSAVSRVPEQNQTTTTVVSRDYAENTSAWLGDRGPALSIQSVGTKTTESRGVTFRELQNSIFSNSQPQLVTLGDQMLLVWVQDDATRDTYNRMRLVYSVHDSLSDRWSEPQPVWDDGHNDGYPILASDGSQAYVLWQKINASLTEENTSDINTTIENSELCIARFDADIGTFVDAQMLTDNDLYEYSHNVVLENGEPVVYWAAAEENAMDASGTNDLYCWINGTDSVLAQDLNYVLSIDACDGNVTYVADIDGVLSSTEDVTATTISYTGTEVYDNSELGTAVMYADYALLDGESVLFLSDMRNIYYSHNGGVKSVLEEPRTMDGNLNVVETDEGITIIWTETVDGWNEIYAVVYKDGEWSSPVMISENGELLTKISATSCDGKLFGVCNANSVTYDEAADEYVKGETNLMLFQAGDFSDIALAKYLNINENTLEAGIETVFNVTVYNNGTKPVDEVTFIITDTLGTETVQTVAVDIPSGGSEAVALTYLVPDNYTTTTLTVTAAIADADVDASDNSMSRTIGNPDLTVTETAVEVLNDGYKITAVVENGSLVDAENIVLSAYTDEENTEFLQSATIGTISRENYAMAEILVTEGALSYSENGTAKIYLRLDADEDQASSADNTICAVVSETEETVCMHPLTEMVTRLEATCTEPGYEAYEICTGCKEAMEEFTVIPARGHNHTASTTQPTCTEQGYTTYTCECGDSYVAEYTDALGHDYEDGICTRCGTEDPYADVPAGLQFEIYDDHVEITGYEGDDAEIVIPAMIDGLQVTEIGAWAFNYCTSLTSIAIPEGVTDIGWHAFDRCSNLTNITIPNSVIHIDNGAFCECTNLISVSIPNGVTEIANGTFENCISLTNVAIPDSVIEIGNYAFYGCASLTSISIPNSVTEIGSGAFYGCTSMKEINVDEDNPNYSSDDYGVLFNKDKTELIQAPGAIAGSYMIPNGVIVIEEYAFQDCTSLTSVTIPDSVVEINDAAFGNCISLISVSISNGVTEIAYATFENCTSLTSVSIPDSVTKIGGDAFRHCISLISVSIPDSVTCIDVFAFCDCISLSSINIPNSVVEIGSGAFSDCTSLTSVMIPNSVVEIGSEAFAYCTGLSSINIPNSVTYIDVAAFRGCTSLTGIHVDEDNPNYSSDARGVLFNKAKTKLILAPGAIAESYIIPGGVAYISRYAFYNCTSLISISIPDSVIEIGDQAFYGCSNLSNFEIPDSVRDISRGAFAHCTSLTSITIPNSVTEIDYELFYGCTSLTSVDIPESVTYIRDYAFYDCSNLTSIDIPVSVTDIGEYAFSCCSNLGSIFIHDGLTNIGWGAFSYCFSLTEFVVDEGNPNYSVDTRGVLFNKDKTELIQAPGAIMGSYHVPYSVTEIYFYAFRYCSGLTGIYVDEDNPNYSSDDHGVLFSKDKTELIQVPGAITGSYAIPDSVSWMWEQAFAGCVNLTSVFVPDSVTYIDWNVFSDCTSLVDVYIPDSVTGIYADAFSGCTSLTSITIPASVTFIGNSVFSGCTHLATICFVGNVPEMVEETFESVTATAYYPADNATWTANVMQNYGGNITWVAYDPNHTHEYTTEVTAPTCTEQGFTAYTCDCGDSYVTDYVDALGHEYVDGKCIRCGEEDPNYEKPVENPFDDVAPGSFFYAPVMWAIENGITNGTSATTFGPNDQCMRAHVVTFLWRAVGCPEPTRTDNPFMDVKPSDFYYKPVLWALENGITSGMDATHFGPTAYCNRAQVVTFLYRTMDNPDVATSTNPFTDVAVGSFYEKPVLWAVENGITNGLSATSFGPNSICNRAQIVTFLYRAFN